MEDKIVKLKNGGVLIYNKNKQNNSTAVEVGFYVGAQQDKKPGTAHFLEHTLFKKTNLRTNSEVERDRNKITFLNATTGNDYLVIKFYRTNKLIKKSLEFAYDVLMNSVVDDEYMDSEKGVIKEELKMTLDDETRDIFIKNYMQSIKKPKFASDIVGSSEENIDKITFKDLLEYKTKYFIGNNFVVSVSSSLSLHKIKKLINEIFVKNIPYKKDLVNVESHYNQTNVDGKTSLKIHNRNQEKAMVLLTFKIDANELDIFGKNYNYTFLSRYLSGSQGDLFLKLRNKGLIYRLSVDISCFSKTSLFNVFFETSREKIKETLNIIKDEVKKVTSELIDDNLIQEYKNNLEYYADEKLLLKPTITCHSNLMDYLNFKKIFKLTKKQRKVLRSGVNSYEVRKVANEIFNKNNSMFVTVLGNADKKDVPNLNYFKENFLISE